MRKAVSFGELTTCLLLYHVTERLSLVLAYNQIELEANVVTKKRGEKSNCLFTLMSLSVM